MKRRGKEIPLYLNYLLILLIFVNGISSLNGMYRGGTLTKVQIVAAPIIFAFLVYFLLKQKEWMYLLIILINVYGLVSMTIGMGAAGLVTVGALYNYVLIGTCYGILRKIRPTRYKKLPFF